MCVQLSSDVDLRLLAIKQEATKVRNIINNMDVCQGKE